MVARAVLFLFSAACFVPLVNAFSLQGLGSTVGGRALAPAAGVMRKPHLQTSSSILALRAIGNFGDMFSGFGGKEQSPAAGNEELKSQLLAACEAAKSGLEGTGPMPQAEFDALVDELVSKNPTENPAVSPLMAGRWQMKWTTEKEILFLLEKGLFGLACTDVYQVIDPEEGTLNNSLDFEEDSFLRVGSSFEPEGDKFEFKFKSCALKWKAFEIPLPPVGAGTGIQVYLDDNLRIQKDSRGDTLIATRT